MKGNIFVSKFWTKLFSFGKADAITIFPFIFLRHRGLKSDMMLINHERIHLRQAIELLIFPFYIWYVLEFLIRYLHYKDFHKAYRNISFEREAYAKQHITDYLCQRKPWSFWKYL